jgi:hypothetical protein
MAGSKLWQCQWCMSPGWEGSHLTNGPRILNHETNTPVDLYVQEHQICCSSYWKSAVGQTGTPSSQPYHPGWELRQCMPTRNSTWSAWVS